MGSSDDSSFLLAAETERYLGVPVVRHGSKKPECVDKVRERIQSSDSVIILAVGHRIPRGRD